MVDNKEKIEKEKMGMNILIKEAYKACKSTLIQEGTLATAKCICDKLTNEDWQKEKLKYGVYWTYPIV